MGKIRKWGEAILRVLAAGLHPVGGKAIEEGLDQVGRWKKRKAALTALLDVEDRKWQPDSSPAALLRADFGIVPFHGRERELAELTAWCEGTGDLRRLPNGEIPPVALRLYTGPGGYGKTRLLRNFARMRRDFAWEAGFLGEGKLVEADKPEGAAGGTAVLFGEATKPLLLVLDYAESRTEEVVAVVKGARESSRQRVRLVLLARSDGDWWNQLHRAGDGVGDFFQGPAVEGPLRLDPLTDSQEARQEVFKEAAMAFAAELSRPVPDVRLPLDGEDFDRVLMIHAAALAAVEGEAVASGGLLDWLLRREERGLERTRRVPSGTRRKSQQSLHLPHNPETTRGRTRSQPGVRRNPAAPRRTAT